MVLYLTTFAVILFLLYGAVRVHLFLGLNHPSEDDNHVETVHQPHLHDVLFSG